MTSQNQNNVDASGSSFTEIGRDQVNQVHIGRDQIIYNFSSTSTDSIASKWSNQSGHSRSPNTSELSGSQNRFHTRDRRRRWKRPNSESWTEDDLRDAYDALQDELPSSTRNTSTYSILKRATSQIRHLKMALDEVKASLQHSEEETRRLREINLALMLGRSPSQTPPRETASPTNMDAAESDDNMPLNNGLLYPGGTRLFLVTPSSPLDEHPRTQVSTSNSTMRTETSGPMRWKW